MHVSCETGDKMKDKKTKINRHQREVTESGMDVCDDCGKEYNAKEVNVFRHSKKNVYLCDHCQDMFENTAAKKAMFDGIYKTIGMEYQHRLVVAEIKKIVEAGIDKVLAAIKEVG